jgi:hypothetical protein
VLVGGELPRGVALGAPLVLAAAGLSVGLAVAGMERAGPLALPALVVALVCRGSTARRRCAYIRQGSANSPSRWL